MSPTLITSERGNTSNTYKHLNHLHLINLHKRNLFDMLLSDGGQSQSAASKTSMSIDNGIEKAKLLFIPILACDTDTS